MEGPVTAIEALLHRLENYTETTFELLKMRSLDLASELASLLVHKLIVLIAVIIFLLFSSVALSIFLGDLLGESYLGFLCVAFIFLFFAIVVQVFLRRQIKDSIKNSIVGDILSKKYEK